MRARARAGIASISVGVMMLATGCASAPTGDELLGDAREVYLDYRAAGAEVQLGIFDGEWVVDAYGDSPRDCGSGGYEFSLRRATPPEWQLDGTPADAAARLEQWLGENGWTDILTRTYTNGIENVIVEAKKPDANAGLLIVDFVPGRNYDGATIYLDSTCQPGDQSELWELQNPGHPNLADDELERDPDVEHPLAEPSFGRTEDGQRRFWPSASDEVQD